MIYIKFCVYPKHFQRGFSCINNAKIDSNKWKNIERSKKQKSENSAESESSGRPVGQVSLSTNMLQGLLINRNLSSYCRNLQVMRALIVAGFAGLVFLTRQRT